MGKEGPSRVDDPDHALLTLFALGGVEIQRVRAVDHQDERRRCDGGAIGFIYEAREEAVGEGDAWSRRAGLSDGVVLEPEENWLAGAWELRTVQEELRGDEHGDTICFTRSIVYSGK